MNSEKVCVVIPVYNEEECIIAVCRRWVEVVGSLVDVRLIVVNDGSRDKTGSLLDALAREEPRLQVIHQANGGHGAAVLRGFQTALAGECPWIFQTDSDDQFDPEDFKPLWERRGESPFILGRRLERHDPAYRLLLSRACRLLIGILFQCRLLDPNIPYRLMRKDYLAQLLSRIPVGTFAPNLFLSILAVRDHQAVLNIPVHHKARESGVPSLLNMHLIKVCFLCGWQLLEFRFHESNR